MARCSSPENYCCSGYNTQLELCRQTDKLRNLGFRQCKTIIMPLIPISYSPLSLVVSIAFTVLSDVPSAPRFLVDIFSFVVHAEFEVGILQRIFFSQTTDSHFAKYRFSFRKLQIFISFRSISFCKLQ